MLTICSFLQRSETREYSSWLSGGSSWLSASSPLYLFIFVFLVLNKIIPWLKSKYRFQLVFAVCRATWCWLILGCVKKVLSQREPPPRSVGLQKWMQNILKIIQKYLSYIIILKNIKGLCGPAGKVAINFPPFSIGSTWHRRSSEGRRMTGQWTGGVWEQCFMRCSTAWYVWVCMAQCNPFWKLLHIRLGCNKYCLLLRVFLKEICVWKDRV